MFESADDSDEIGDKKEEGDVGDVVVDEDVDRDGHFGVDGDGDNEKVGRSRAFSTLSLFDDPLLSSDRSV